MSRKYINASVRVDDWVDAEIEVSDIIDDIDTEDLLKELKKRKVKATELDFSDEKIKQVLSLAGLDLNLRNLLKMEAILEKFDSIPESDLDNFLGNY